MKTSSHWRNKYNKEKPWIISFSYVKTLTSLAIWGSGGGGGGGGGGGFNNQTGPILVHIYPLIYINLHVKYGSNLMLGRYIKSRGTRGTKMSANADLITVETYVQQGKTRYKCCAQHNGRVANYCHVPLVIRRVHITSTPQAIQLLALCGEVINMHLRTKKDRSRSIHLRTWDTSMV